MRYLVNQLIRGREGNNTHVVYYQGDNEAKAIVAAADAATAENDPWYTVKAATLQILEDELPDDYMIQGALRRIQEFVDFARYNLEEEHEGNVRHASEQIVALALEMNAFIQSM